MNISRCLIRLEDTHGAAMEIFCAEKVAVVEDRSNKTCRCGEKLELVRVIVDF